MTLEEAVKIYMDCMDNMRGCHNKECPLLSGASIWNKECNICDLLGRAEVGCLSM